MSPNCVTTMRDHRLIGRSRAGRASPIRAYAFLLCLPLMLACGAEHGVRDVIVRDSAGIRIVENGATDAATAVTLRPRPLVDIGGALDDTTQLLYQIGGAHLLSDGRIVVANRGSQQLRYYDPTGRFLYASGGKGEGPGEFTYLAWTARCGTDTVIAYDLGSRQAKVFDPQGQYTRAFRITSPGGQSPYGPAHCWGSIYSALDWGAATGTRPTIGYHRGRQLVYITDARGANVTPLTRIPGAERWGFERGSRPALFGKTPVHAVAPGGVFVGSADRAELRFHSFDGTLQQIIRWRAPNGAVTASHRTTLREEALAGARSPNQRRAIERQLAEQPVPDSLPAYARILVSDRQQLWVQRYQAPGDSVLVWLVFHPDGKLTSRAALPARFTLYEITGERLIGRWEDTLGVERVRVYTFTR